MNYFTRNQNVIKKTFIYLFSFFFFFGGGGGARLSEFFYKESK